MTPEPRITLFNYQKLQSLTYKTPDNLRQPILLLILHVLCLKFYVFQGQQLILSQDFKSNTYISIKD